MASLNPPPIKTPLDTAPDPVTKLARVSLPWVGWFSGLMNFLSALNTTINSLTSAQIAGTVTNDNAPAGFIGESLVPSNLTGVALTNGIAVNLSSITLPAGDYEVSGVVHFTPAGTTTVTGVTASVSATANVLGPVGTRTQLNTTFTTGQAQEIGAPVQRISLAAPATIYLTAFSFFGTSTMAANGYLHVRRPR